MRCDVGNNRIGDACWYRLWDGHPRKPLKWTGGTLRAWSTDCIEAENGFGLFPVGVVEDRTTGCCYSVPVVDICFGAIPPGGGTF